MELVFLGKANTHGLNSVKLPAYLLCLPQASIGRIDSRGGQNYLSTTSLLSLKLSPAPSRAAFFEPNAWPFSMVSRPEGFHPRPLAERCVNLSIHTAPIRRTCWFRMFASARRGPH